MLQEDQEHEPEAQLEPRVAGQLLQYMAGSHGTMRDTVEHRQVQSFLPLARMLQDEYVQPPPFVQPAPAYVLHEPYVDVQLSMVQLVCINFLPGTCPQQISLTIRAICGAIGKEPIANETEEGSKAMRILRMISSNLEFRGISVVFVVTSSTGK
jgi:hypothetical protein